MNNLKTFTFQQDGTLAHTAKSDLQYLRKNHFDVIDWTTQNPDLNPIKHFWAYIKRKLGNQHFATVYEIKKIILIWKSITSDFYRNFVICMTTRINEIIPNKGCATK